jgi:RimJ/RimL family protein N-acetyltransferase
MAIELETSRLILKEFCAEDARHLFELNSDPEVTKYVNEGAYDTIDNVYEFIKTYGQYKKYKMGRLNMFNKQTGEYIGWCGLKFLELSDQVDIGYRLQKKYWGNGYATEASIACLNYGFFALNLDKIIGTAIKENEASINIFKKLGLKYSHDINDHNQPCVVYVITKEEWNQNSQH